MPRLGLARLGCFQFPVLGRRSFPGWLLCLRFHLLASYLLSW
jgi:hypothetical protein